MRELKGVLSANGDGEKKWTKDLTLQEFRMFADMFMTGRKDIFEQAGWKMPKDDPSNRVVKPGRLATTLAQVDGIPSIQLAVDELGVISKDYQIMINHLDLTASNDKQAPGQLQCRVNPETLKCTPSSILGRSVADEVRKTYDGIGFYKQMGDKFKGILTENQMTLKGFGVKVNEDLQSVRMVIAS